MVEYHLASPYDVSTALYAGAGEEFSVRTEENSPTGMAFNDDGSKLFIIGSIGDAVVEYDLSAPYDVSTAVYAGVGEEFSVEVQEKNPTGMMFNGNGSKLFVIGNLGDAVVEYDLGSPYDVSTAVYAGANNEFSVAAQERVPQMMAFNNDGSKMFIVGNGDGAVVEYDLVPSFDSYAESVANDGTITANTDPLTYTVMNGTFLDADNDNILDTGFSVAHLPAGLVAQFALSDGDTVATLELSGTAVANDVGDSISDLGVSLDGTVSMAVGTATVNCTATVGIDFLVDPMVVCGTPYEVSTAVHTGSGDEFSVRTEERLPNDMAFNGDGSKMFIIGDDDDAVVEYNLSVPYDVSTAVHAGAGEEFSVATEEIVPTAMAFDNYGNKMFIVGTINGMVEEYHLAVSYDVSSAVHAVGEGFSVKTEEASPMDLAFSSDGTKMFIVGAVGGAIVEYDLGTAYDVSTAVYAGDSERFSVLTEETEPRGIAFNHDGSKMFVTGRADDAVVEYSLGIAYDVSTAAYAGAGKEFSVVGEEGYPMGMAFNSSGTKLFVIGRDDGAVVEYDLVPAFDAYMEVEANDGTITANTNPLAYTVMNGTFLDADNDDILDAGFTVANLPAGLVAHFVLSDGDTVATLELSGMATAHDNVNSVSDLGVSFDGTASMAMGTATVNCGTTVGIDFLVDPMVVCGTPYKVSTAVHAGNGEEFSVTAEETAPSDMVFNNDGTKMFVLGFNSDAVVEYTLVTPYDVSTATAVTTFSVGAQEGFPTGMAFDGHGMKMFVIGTFNGVVEEYHLTAPYDISTAVYATGAGFPVRAEEPVPMGMAFNGNGTKMFIIGSVGGAVVEYDLGTPYDVSTAVYAGAGEEFSVSAEELIPGGMVFNGTGSKLFVLGNGAKAVIEYHLTIPYDVSTAVYTGAGEEFSIGGEEAAPTGMAFDREGKKMFVIGTSDGAVVEYDLVPAFDAYMEVEANDGSIAPNTAPFIFTVTNNTFLDADNDDLLDAGFTVANLPAGLTARFVLSEGDTVATLELLGNATLHDDTDVVDLGISLDGAAATTLHGTGTSVSCNVAVRLDFLADADLDIMRHGKRFVDGVEQGMKF